MSTSDRLVAFYDEELPIRATRPVDCLRADKCQNFIASCRAAGHSAVIEVGCGAGKDGQLLHDGGLSYVGIDRSLVGVQICRDAGLVACAASAPHLPFRDGAFDAGWTMSTLMHLAGEEMDLAVGELARVIRPGGILDVGVWGAEKCDTRIDQHGRFFQHRCDLDFRRMLSIVGTVAEFDTWDWLDDGGHYQWARVLIR